MYYNLYKSVFEIKRSINKLFLVLILLLFFTLRLVGLGTDITNSDGPRWHRRSEKFLTALKTGDYRSTYQHYQPGVTLMWLNSFVKQASFWYQLLYTDNPKTLGNADWYPVVHGLSKSVVVLMLGGLLLCQMYFVRRIFSPKVALLYGFFMAIEPYMLGIDRWFHLTSLEVYFGFAAFLSLLSWLKFGAVVMDGSFREWLRNNKFLASSAVLFAFAVLSKLTSLILWPLFLMVFVTAFMLRVSILCNLQKRAVDFEYLLKDFAKFFVLFVLPFFAVFVVTFFVFFPALWVDPGMVFTKFYTALTQAVTEDVRSFQIAGINMYLYYPLVLLFKLSPVTLLLLVLSLAFSRKILRFAYSNYIYLYLLVFYVFLTFADKKIDRYTLTLVPPLLLLVAVFVSSLGRKLRGFFILFGLFFTLWLVAMYHPVYSVYYSPIVGGTMRALDVGIYENSGEYLSQAALYLNTKGRDKYTYVPNGVESFSYYYEGNLQREFDEKTNFVVTSLDIDRKEPFFERCSKLERGFGPRDSSLPHAGKLQGVVFIYWCAL